MFKNALYLCAAGFILIISGIMFALDRGHSGIACLVLVGGIGIVWYYDLVP